MVDVIKSYSAGKSWLLRTTTMSPVHGVDRGFDDKKERAMTAVTLSAIVAVIVALYAAMFGAVYLWSRYAPISSDDVASVSGGDGNRASGELASVSGVEPNRANQYLIIGGASSSAIRRDTEKSLTVYREDIVDGLEKPLEAFIGMLDGKNFGKVVVQGVFTLRDHWVYRFVAFDLVKIQNGRAGAPLGVDNRKPGR